MVAKDNTFGKEKQEKISLKRQGDLLIVKIPVKLEGLDKLRASTDKVLAVGEVTGHKHQLTGSVQIYDNVERETVGQLMSHRDAVEYLDQAIPSKCFIANSDQQLVHQEHKAIDIEKGAYVVINEREYNPFNAALVSKIKELDLKLQRSRTVTE